MNLKAKWAAAEKVPVVRQGLFILGCLLLAITPLVGIIPGPGGVVTFGLGLGLVLKYSDWAKRRYVKFKRKHPGKGRWADWGLRRRSAKRREALRLEQETRLAEADAVDPR
jgi:hypothetical protein